MKTSNAPAPNASSRMIHMTRASGGARRLAAPILGRLGVVTVATLVACSSAPLEPAAPAAPAAGAVESAPPGPGRDDLAAATIDRPRARWVAVRWGELPGWDGDRLGEFWGAFLRSCERPAAGWRDACAKARQLAPAAASASDPAVRDWVQRQLRPYRIESVERDPIGLATGYFEPLIEASRVSRPGFRVALYAAAGRPGDAKPVLDAPAARDPSRRAEGTARPRDRVGARSPRRARAAGAGLGPPRLRERTKRRAGSARPRRLSQAHNDQPYRSVGRWLIEQGELRSGEASWPAIRAWARQHPARVDEMLLQQPALRLLPRGAARRSRGRAARRAGRALSPGRSIAVDPQSVPYGTPVWLDTTEPLATRPLRRLVVAQDTGAAIVGAVRADYFWGWGDDRRGRRRQDEAAAADVGALAGVVTGAIEPA